MTHVLTTERLPWRTLSIDDATIHWAQDEASARLIEQALAGSESIPPAKRWEAISEKLRALDAHFAIIIDRPDGVFISADTVRSIPVFYTPAPFLASNCARTLHKNMKRPKLSDTGLLEFKMSGYCLGDHTLFEGLNQVLPGEFIWFDKRSGNIERFRYFQYYPIEPETFDSTAMLECIDESLNSITRNIIERAGDSAIVLPLSGGWDSRLLLAKFHQWNAPRIITFSYGPRGNYEAMAAREIAAILNVPWIDRTTHNGRNAKRLFRELERSECMRFADGLSSIPVMEQYETLATLKREKLIPEDSFIVNGQTGDFVTGGHIQQAFMAPETGFDDVFEWIMNKHFGLWTHLGPQANQETLRKRIVDTMGEHFNHLDTPWKLASAYESWEWQERQSKYVVNGQRLYEYFGYSWALPLWRPAFMNLWAEVPMRDRFAQGLFSRYLYRYNYENLFPEGDRSESRRAFGLWEQYRENILKSVRFTMGQKAASHLLKFSACWGHYRNLYDLLGMFYVAPRISKCTIPPQGRGFIALLVDLWLRENHFSKVL